MSWTKVRLVPEVEGIGEAEGGTDARRQPGKTGSIRGGCEQQSNKRTCAAGAAACRHKGPEERRARKGKEAVEATVHCIVLKVREIGTSAHLENCTEERRKREKQYKLISVLRLMFVYKGIRRKNGAELCFTGERREEKVEQGLRK